MNKVVKVFFIIFMITNHHLYSQNDSIPKNKLPLCKWASYCSEKIFLYFAASSGEYDPKIPTFGTGSVRLNNFIASSTYKIIVSLIKVIARSNNNKIILRCARNGGGWQESLRVVLTRQSK